MDALSSREPTTAIRVGIELVARSRPYAGTGGSTACKGYQKYRTREAEADIWPDGNIPRFASQYNPPIERWFKDRDLPMPSVRTLQRFRGGR
jgi:hypothetical protein